MAQKLFLQARDPRYSRGASPKRAEHASAGRSRSGPYGGETAPSCGVRPAGSARARGSGSPPPGATPGVSGQHYSPALQGRGVEASLQTFLQLTLRLEIWDLVVSETPRPGPVRPASAAAMVFFGEDQHGCLFCRHRFLLLWSLGQMAFPEHTQPHSP